MYLIAIERGRRKHVTDRDDRLAAAVVRRRAAVRGAVRAAAPLDRRGRARDLRRQGVVGAPVRRGDRRARVRGGRRRGRAAASSAGASRRRPASPAGCSPRGRRSSLEDVQSDPRFAREVADQDRLRAQGPDGRAAPRRGARARRARRCSTARSASASRCRRWSCSGCSPTRPRSPLTLLRTARRARAALAGDGDVAVVARVAAALDRARRAPSRRRPGAARRARARARRLARRETVEARLTRASTAAMRVGSRAVLVAATPCSGAPRRRRRPRLLSSALAVFQRCASTSRRPHPCALVVASRDPRAWVRRASSDISNPPCARSRIRGTTAH